MFGVICGFKVVGFKVCLLCVYKKRDFIIGKKIKDFFEDINEWMYSFVCVCFVLEGFGFNDKGVWEVLVLKGKWVL